MNYETIARTGDLEIVEERVMVGIPRGDGELRVTFTRAKTANGETAWHSIREYYKADDGTWRPTKKGITIRGRELHAVAIALLRACASSIPPQTVVAAKAVVEALSGRRS
jgi:hypothetical protein